MATFSLTNSKKELPKFNKFIGSLPCRSACYFQQNNKLNTSARKKTSSFSATAILNQRVYYFSGQGEPKVGDYIFLDIHGANPYMYSLNFVQFKEDNNYWYYLEIVNYTVVEIHKCPKITFKVFEAVDSTNGSYCEKDSFYPDGLPKNKEVFYHDGNTTYPRVGDTIYYSNNTESTLNNFIGLFKIFNEVYYYVISNENGKVIEIKTCSEPDPLSVRSILVKEVRKNENFYDVYLCKEYNNNPLVSLYYESDSEMFPNENTLLYYDQGLTQLVVQSSFYIGSTLTNHRFLNVDIEGNLSFRECLVTNNFPPGAGDPTESFNFFLGKIADSFCGDVISDLVEGTVFRKFYHSNTNIPEGSMPNVGSTIYKDELLSIPYGETVVFLRSQNQVSYYAMINSQGEYQGTQSCNQGMYNFENNPN